MRQIDPLPAPALESTRPLKEDGHGALRGRRDGGGQLSLRALLLGLAAQPEPRRRPRAGPAAPGPAPGAGSSEAPRDRPRDPAPPRRQGLLRLSPDVAPLHRASAVRQGLQAHRRLRPRHAPHVRVARPMTDRPRQAAWSFPAWRRRPDETIAVLPRLVGICRLRVMAWTAS